MESSLNLTSLRARKARFSRHLTRPLAITLLLFNTGLLLAASLLGTLDTHWAYLLAVPAVLCVMVALWWWLDLSVLGPTGPDLNQRLHRDVLIRLRAGDQLTPQLLWQRLSDHWQVRFLTNHLLVDPHFFENLLSTTSSDLLFVWDKSIQLADAAGCTAIEPGHLAASLILTSNDIVHGLSQFKLTADDVTAINGWLGRDLAGMRQAKPSFGGIGRDWANGFTPQLNHFGQNISRSIEEYGAHFGSLTESAGVQAVRAAFAQGSTAIALIGDDGVGKTRHAYALAQNLLAESHDRRLQHQQIVKLNPSPIISAARGPGDLEYLVDMLLAEASHAGNIILFFDDAPLFFQEGPGSFNATQLLLPAVQSRAVRLIFAMTPHDFQQLKADNAALAGQLTPVVLQEPDETGIMSALEDAATRLELSHDVLISYAAIKEAYRLSGRYEQDMAYPGKAIRLLEQSLPYAEQQVVVDRSIQAAIEQTTGVKASTAAPAEADQLLHLEDAIHQRMINQSHAVTVVANALRRARAGVANPKRPIGSFLFLGPTGVGKTELSKAIAATYFGNEASMIRLDMSEYQQESDVARLLSAGHDQASSLLGNVRERPFSVVLLDEIEKAHPNILNLLLQMLDEGQLTDTDGRAVSFKDCVIICTSNAGADRIREHIAQGEELASFEEPFVNELIDSGQFKPELLNRFDEIVLFRPLNTEELAQVVRLLLQEVNQTLAKQQISVGLTDAAVAKIVAVGNDPRLGARPMRRALQRAVEDTVAKKILSQEVQPGQSLTLDAPDLPL